MRLREDGVPRTIVLSAGVAVRRAAMRSLVLMDDVKGWPDYAAANNAEDPASDGAAISRLLAEPNLAFPKKAARVRMLHLPTADRRTELMIIGEALPDNSPVPVRQGGVVLDKEAPAAAQTLLEDVRKDLIIRKK